MESGAERSREIFNRQRAAVIVTRAICLESCLTRSQATPNTGTTKPSTTSNVIKFVVNMVAPTPNPEAYPVSEMAVEAPAADPPSKDENKKPDISPQNSSEEQSVPDGSWAEPFNSKAEKLPKGANRTRL